LGFGWVEPIDKCLNHSPFCAAIKESINYLAKAYNRLTTGASSPEACGCS
jgi:hypothetical protein